MAYLLKSLLCDTSKLTELSEKLNHLHYEYSDGTKVAAYMDAYTQNMNWNNI